MPIKKAAKIVNRALNDRLCGYGPQRMRARCSGYRYFPNPLGIVTALNDRLAEQLETCTGAAAPMPSPGEKVPPKGADVEYGR